MTEHRSHDRTKFLSGVGSLNLRLFDDTFHSSSWARFMKLLSDVTELLKGGFGDVVENSSVRSASRRGGMAPNPTMLH